MNINKNIPNQDFVKLEKNISYTFSDKKLLQVAITHKSFVNENTGYTHNERMEYFGDTVLQMCITEHLYKTCTELDEGVMSLIRASVVNTNSLYKVATKLDLDKFVLTSKGVNVSLKSGFIVLSNIVEAIIGAIYLDGGIDASTKFIEKNFFTEIDLLIKSKDWQDPKTQLQELTQKKYKCIPQYIVINESGPDHKKRFTIDVLIDDKKIASGVGDSKRNAEFVAATEAIKKYN